MTFPHLFEFMDLDWLPSSLRGTMREILEVGNSLPFRPYYRWVADEVLRTAASTGSNVIVELGAGTAPVTRVLASDPQSNGLRLVPSDSNPDAESYRSLEQAYPGKVQPIHTPVDFSQPLRMEPDSLLFLSGAFHHLPPTIRPGIIKSLAASGCPILVFEPLRKSPLSVVFVFGSVVPALLLPIWYIARPGRLRRLLWCWLLPLAPLLFWWDGVVSCLRMWTEREWRNELQKVLGPDVAVTLKTSLFCQMIGWNQKPNETPASRTKTEQYVQ